MFKTAKDKKKQPEPPLPSPSSPSPFLVFTPRHLSAGFITPSSHLPPGLFAFLSRLLFVCISPVFHRLVCRAGVIGGGNFIRWSLLLHQGKLAVFMKFSKHLFIVLLKFLQSFQNFQYNTKHDTRVFKIYVHSPQSSRVFKGYMKAFTHQDDRRLHSRRQ